MVISQEFFQLLRQLLDRAIIELVTHLVQWMLAVGDQATKIERCSHNNGLTWNRIDRVPEVLDHTHNMLVERTFQTGIPGLIVYLWLLIQSWIVILRRIPPPTAGRQRCAAVGWIAVLVMFMTYGQFSLFFALTPALLFWSVLGAALAAGRRSDANEHDALS